MQCPKCDAAMEEVVYDRITIDRCTSCHGIWFDALEHERLKKAKGSEQIDDGDRKVGMEFDKIQRINCPVCGHQMLPMIDNRHRKLRYESCGTCFGVFFDAGEFRSWKRETVMEFLRSLMGSEEPHRL